MKLKHTMVIMILALIVLLIPQISSAATSSVVLEEIEVTTETGTYETGDVITFKAKFSGNVVGEDKDTSLTIKFGESELYGEHYIYNEGAITGNTIIYKYTIEDTDSGELSLKRISGSLEDENGDYINIETPTEFTGSKITANPIKWTDVSKVTFKITGEDNYYKLQVSNMVQLKGHDYYIYFTRSEVQPEIAIDDNGRVTNYDKSFSESINIEPQLELNGDIYVWLCEEQRNYETGKLEQEFIVEKYKLERPAQRALGQRISLYFHDDSTASFLWEPHDYNNEDNRKVNIKIGKIENSTILNAIKNNEAGALGKLLEYAKSATAIYTTTIPLGQSAELTSKMGLEDENYYYIYMELEDEDGKYYPVEDIDLGQAKKLADGKMFIYGYTDTNFSWESDENCFSNFSDAKVGISELKFAGSTADPDSVEQCLKLKIYNIVSNLEKEHGFYYYISNSKTDVPDVTSDLWTKVESFIIDANTGACEINTTDITKLSYYKNLNLNSDIYVYVYEVVGDEEITAEKISGDYKLVLNAKLLSWEEKEDGKDDTVIDEPEIPQTGATPLGMVVALMVIVALVLAYIKMNSYRDIK